ncbi:MAG: hypothetical protein KIS92_04860 [Planctomycetota bacterium]|nr:hypothetical protein [Planctomycetota bacterium]
MKLTYCEKCGALITDAKPSKKLAAEPVVCEACKSGSKGEAKPRRLSRDSGQIPRAKVTQALKMDGKPPAK